MTYQIRPDGNFAAELTLRFPRVKHIRHDRASSGGQAKQEGEDEPAREEKVWDAWDSVCVFLLHWTLTQR